MPNLSYYHWELSNEMLRNSVGIYIFSCLNNFENGSLQVIRSLFLFS